jgi:nucleoside-diphosphate-sugar epimerase
MESEEFLIEPGEPVLVTGAAGFIGSRVAALLAEKGFRNVRCLVRPSSDLARLRAGNGHQSRSGQMQIIAGNLLSHEDCLAATKDIRVVYHLAAGTGTKSFSESFLNSVVTTRNLLNAVLEHGCLRRFVSLSSFAVYANRKPTASGALDESALIEDHPESRGEAYCYAKVKQDELVTAYGRKHGLPFVLLRPGVVYGPGKHTISGRVGVDTFGIFLHLGGGNELPLTYVDNCAEAIVLAGLKKGLEGEIFNIVDDELPSSRQFLRLYKRNVRKFRSFYLPHALSYLFCYLWERYSKWSDGQLPPVFSRDEWAAFWKHTRYSNRKLKERLGWSPRFSTQEGLQLFFESCRKGREHA